MAGTTDTLNKWSLGTKNGIILSLITICVSTINNLQIQFIGSANGFASSILWIFQLVGSIWFLRRCMQGYAAETGERAFSYGLIICLISSLLCGIYDSVSYTWLFPKLQEVAMASIDQTIEMMPNYPDSAKDMMYNIIAGFTKWSLITTFIKCFLIGWIVSSVISNRIDRAKLYTELGIGDKKADDEDELA